MIEDFWDPNTWADAKHECRIYADDRATIYAVVDCADYAFFSRWRWSWKGSRASRNKYLYRTDNSAGQHTSLYLHVAILKRAGIVKPTPQHFIADHRNGDTLDCQRSNLRWATRSMNRMNVRGVRPYDMLEDGV